MVIAEVSANNANIQPYSQRQTLRHIFPYSGIFRQIQACSEPLHSEAYSCILRHIQNPQLFQVYSEPQTYLVSFRHVVEVLLKNNLCIFCIFTKLWHLWQLIYEAKSIIYRSSHSEMFCEIVVLRHFTKFTRKNLC